MPHLDAWRRALAEEWGEMGAVMLATRALRRYQALYALWPRFARHDMQSYLERAVLPGLALYQAMLEETGTQEGALTEVQDLFEVLHAHGCSLLPSAGCSSAPCQFHLDKLAAYGAPGLAPFLSVGQDKAEGADETYGYGTEGRSGVGGGPEAAARSER